MSFLPVNLYQGYLGMLEHGIPGRWTDVAYCFNSHVQLKLHFELLWLRSKQKTSENLRDVVCLSLILVYQTDLSTSRPSMRSSRSTPFDLTNVDIS